MKTFEIEGRIIIRQSIKITANSRKEAIAIAEQTDGNDWETIEEEPRQLVSIS